MSDKLSAEEESDDRFKMTVNKYFSFAMYFCPYLKYIMSCSVRNQINKAQSFLPKANKAESKSSI